MGNIPPRGQGAARGLLQSGWLGPWHPSGSPGLGRRRSGLKVLIEGVALQAGANGVLTHGERLVQPLGTWPRSLLLFHLALDTSIKCRAVEGEKWECLSGQGRCFPLLRLVVQGWAACLLWIMTT